MKDSTVPLWQPAPDAIARTQIGAFMRAVAEHYGVRAESYEELDRWSVERRADFWSLVWDFCGVNASAKGTDPAPR
jgi:acetoacetyl-CoA synthetase